MQKKNIMNYKTICLIATTCLTLCCCTNQEKMNNNPLMQPYETPYGVPPFDEIKNEHFIPAIKAGIEKHNKEIEAIVNNSEEPNFENTILPFDKAGEDLDRAVIAFYCIMENNTNDTIQQLAQEIMPLLSMHSDEISMNDALFTRIKKVYFNRDKSNLDNDQIKTVERYYEDFVLSGADLLPNDKEILKEINSELSKLYLTFGDNLLAETNDFKLYIDNEADLAGLPQGVIDQAAAEAKNSGHEGKWLFTTKKPSVIPFLQFAENRDLREKLYRGYYMRGNNDNKYDNKEIINKIVNLRVRKAHLLGYDNFGQYQVSKNMAKSEVVAHDFIYDIYKEALKVAKDEVKEMQKIIKKEGGKFDLASWDWWYYAEKVRKEKYNLDENELKPYFQLENVRDGMFLLTTKLYGLQFELLKDIPTYHPDVEVFKISEANGDLVGLLYLDYFPRESKGQGAWCSTLRDGTTDKDGNRVYPIATITCNFTQPTGDLPALLSFDETETLFHEFGHAIQGLFSYNKYSRISGNFPRDMVELPSQIMENWCSEPQMLKMYAKHYKTGEAIPDELIEKIVKSNTFNTGFNTTELLAAALLDFEWNTMPKEKNVDVNKFEADYLKSIGLIDQILPRYRSTYFSHIFSSDGYSAGYYVYTWAEVLDKDAFEAFKESGDIFNQEIAGKFRNYVLTNIGQDDPMAQYVKFRGKEPSNEPYLKSRGLK